jgi:signal transduction histidine kinase
MSETLARHIPDSLDSLIAVPCGHEELVLGFFLFAGRRGSYSDAEWATMKAYARLAALAIQRHRQAVEKRRQDTKTCHAHKMAAVSTLAGGVAHVFNNLMTGILGNAELLKMNLPAGAGEELFDRLERVCKNAERAGRVANQFLDFANSEPFRPELISLNQTVRTVTKTPAQPIPETIEIVLRLDSTLWNCMADPRQMVQMLKNLVQNAVEAMPDGGRVTISTRNTHIGTDRARELKKMEPGPYVGLTVSDTGTGGDPEIQDRVFDPFFTTKSFGRGLGLAVVYGIVSGHRGHVEISMSPADGTTVDVLLPAVPICQWQDARQSPRKD